MTSSPADDDDDDPSCFPILDLFRRIASAGGLGVKQEQKGILTLVQSSKSGTLDSKPQDIDEVQGDDIVFSIVNDDSGVSGNKAQEVADETIRDETVDSSASASNPPSQAIIEASSTSAEASSELMLQKMQAADQAATIQQHQQEQMQHRKEQLKQEYHDQLKSNPDLLEGTIFGLGMVMESGLEELEDETEFNFEDADEDDDPQPVLAVKQNSTSCIRWSEDNDPDAVNVTVHEVECLKDRIDMWWQGSEFDVIKHGINEAISFCKSYNRNHVELIEDIMKCDCLEDEDLMMDLLKDLLSTSDSSTTSESFFRGLESHLSSLISKYRKRHTKKVLSYQKKLKDKTEEESWDLLREESLDKSEPLSAFARRMGQFDEMVVAKAKKKKVSLWGL